MDKIIPRWEWRTFGTAFGAAEATFAATRADGHPGERRALPARPARATTSRSATT